MSRRPARFTEADLRRATKIAIERGLEIAIDPNGTIRLVPTAANNPTKTTPTKREIVL
jgi:hypothetical protein